MKCPLKEVASSWEDLGLNIKDEDVELPLKRPIIINNNEELKHYVSCEECPSIDFSKHTLLLSFGIPVGSVFAIEYVYLHRYSTGYVLNVGHYPSIASVIRVWQTAIVIDKINDDSLIELKINHLIK